VDRNRTLWVLSLGLMTLAATLLFYDIESGYAARICILTALAFAILTAGVGIDFWRRISQSSPLIDTRKHPAGATVAFFGTMLILGGWLAHETLSGSPPSRRDMQVVAVSFFIWLEYNALIFTFGGFEAAGLKLQKS